MMRQPRLLWADLHNHNEVGYGKGSLDRSYKIAANTLDVYAFTAHGFWPDPPDNDPKMVDYHLAAFSAVSEAFPEVIAEANRQYVPGKFVTLIGYEWHSTRWGDYVVLFPDDSGELHRARSLEELQGFVRKRGALMIPHHVAYRQGWRGLDWTAVDPKLSPLVEVFSEHGNSFASADLWPMTAHSMGGITESQTMTAQLRAGAHFGFTAGTDTHFGYPGSHGEGITGIYCGELTRAAVFEALRNRHTLAATGDRIALHVDSGGALPGSSLPANAPRRFGFKVNPLAPLDYVEVIKNGSRLHLWPGRGDNAPEGAAHSEYILRVEWGWGRMEHADETDWRIHLEVIDGDLNEVIPCMGGGEPAIGRINLVDRDGPNAVAISSFTSRRNPQPINGVVLRVSGSGSTRLACRAEGAMHGEKGGCQLRGSLAQLQCDDVWGSLLPRFSSPRIRIGRARLSSALAMAGSFEDNDPGERDLYVFKARQTNGHTAWASPYLFTGSAHQPGSGSLKTDYLKNRR